MDLCKAYAVVANGFMNKRDKGGNPYFEHCIAVMDGLPNNLPEYVYIAALAHDFIEDIPNGERILRDNGCDENTIDLIKLVSKTQGETYSEYKEKVFSNKFAMMIKRSDLIHNSNICRLKGITHKDIIRTIQYHEFYLEIENRLKSI